MDSSADKCWMSHFVILGVFGLFCHFHPVFELLILLANTVSPDQMPHYVPSDLGLHCGFALVAYDPFTGSK